MPEESCITAESAFAIFSRKPKKSGILRVLKEAGGETFYLGYSKKHDDLVFGVTMNVNGKECEGYLSMKYQDNQFGMGAIHLRWGDAITGNVLEYARTRFEDLKDLQMD